MPDGSGGVPGLSIGFGGNDPFGGYADAAQMGTFSNLAGQVGMPSDIAAYIAAVNAAPTGLIGSVFGESAENKVADFLAQQGPEALLKAPLNFIPGLNVLSKLHGLISMGNKALGEPAGDLSLTGLLGLQGGEPASATDVAGMIGTGISPGAGLSVSDILSRPGNVSSQLANFVEGYRNRIQPTSTQVPLAAGEPLESPMMPSAAEIGAYPTTIPAIGGPIGSSEAFRERMTPTQALSQFIPINRDPYIDWIYSDYPRSQSVWGEPRPQFGPAPGQYYPTTTEEGIMESPPTAPQFGPAPGQYYPTTTEEVVRPERIKFGRMGDTGGSVLDALQRMASVDLTFPGSTPDVKLLQRATASGLIDPSRIYMESQEKTPGASVAGWSGTLADVINADLRNRAAAIADRRKMRGRALSPSSPDWVPVSGIGFPTQAKLRTKEEKARHKQLRQRIKPSTLLKSNKPSKKKSTQNRGIIPGGMGVMGGM